MIQMNGIPIIVVKENHIKYPLSTESFVLDSIKYLIKKRQPLVAKYLIRDVKQVLS